MPDDPKDVERLQAVKGLEGAPYVLVNVTGVPTHHYFVLDLRGQAEPLRDAEGRVLVYTDRVPAAAEAVARLGPSGWLVVGMGDEKWRLFQAEMPHVVVGG